MGEARKLTEAQAKVLANIDNGWKLLKTVGGFIFVDGRLTYRAPTVSVEKLLHGGALLPGERLPTGNFPITITQAGRAALARHRGETP
ncbi:hypothetical protein ACHMW5_13845 [Azospirillum melinis]|uniref:hypothetical protein n=1 Tax=Azospirillum melinis TaxID=328839 RepID=UPI00375795CF